MPFNSEAVFHDALAKLDPTSGHSAARDYLDIYGETWLRQYGPNLALCYATFKTDEHDHEARIGPIGVHAIAAVYAAAKVAFGMRPGSNFHYDLDTAISCAGSPWEQRCMTPEQWAVCFARRRLETQEAHIEDHFDAEDFVPKGAAVLLDLDAAGVPRAAVSLDLLCYGNCRAARLLHDCSPFPQTAAA